MSYATRQEYIEAETVLLESQATMAEVDSINAKAPAIREMPMTGAEILSTVKDRWLKRYVHFNDDRAAIIATLWAAHTHMRRHGRLIDRVTPRLYVFSGEPESGKSTLLECFNLICPFTYGLDIDATQYGLQYTLAREHATVLIDEGDVATIPSRVIAIINAGYTENGTVLNGTGSKATRVPVFGPIALAALDSIETDQYSGKLKAMFTRGIKIRMEPGPHEKWSKKTEQTGDIVRGALAWWADKVMTENDVREADPYMPEGMSYREAQIWARLVVIADFAGGDWPHMARDATYEIGAFPDGFDEL